jgi:hypothetical protein
MCADQKEESKLILIYFFTDNFKKRKNLLFLGKISFKIILKYDCL